MFVPRWRWRRPCRSSGARTTTTGRSIGRASPTTSCWCWRTCWCHPVTTPRDGQLPSQGLCALTGQVPWENNPTFLWHRWELQSSVQPVEITSDNNVAAAQSPAPGNLTCRCWPLVNPAETQSWTNQLQVANFIGVFSLSHQAARQPQRWPHYFRDYHQLDCFIYFCCCRSRLSARYLYIFSYQYC